MANRVTDRQLGGIRPEGLKVFEPLTGVPATRADCVDGERACRFIACRFHLWRVDGRDRAGRRHGGRHPPTTLRAEWLREPQPPSCALDVADAIREHGQPPRMEVIAALIGLRPSQARELLAGALKKLRAAGSLEFADEP